MDLEKLNGTLNRMITGKALEIHRNGLYAEGLDVQVVEGGVKVWSLSFQDEFLAWTRRGVIEDKMLASSKARWLEVIQ